MSPQSLTVNAYLLICVLPTWLLARSALHRLPWVSRSSYTGDVMVYSVPASYVYYSRPVIFWRCLLRFPAPYLLYIFLAGRKKNSRQTLTLRGLMCDACSVCDTAEVKLKSSVNCLLSDTRNLPIKWSFCYLLTFLSLLLAHFVVSYLLMKWY